MYLIPNIGKCLKVWPEGIDWKEQTEKDFVRLTLRFVMSVIM